MGELDGPVTVTFAGSGDAFGSGGRMQACIHVSTAGETAPVVLDCGATSLVALRRCGLDPSAVGTVVVSHLHGDHFGGLPFLILDGQFAPRTLPLTVVGPPGIQERLTQALEVLFPGMSAVERGYELRVVELEPGTAVAVEGAEVRAWEVVHPSGAPPLGVRLSVAGRQIGYSGDTAWTDRLVEIADGTDLFIVESYRWDSPVPHHLTHTVLAERRPRLRSARVVLTHMSAEMLAHVGRGGDAVFDAAHDGMVITLADDSR